MNNFYSIEGSDTIGLKVTSTGGELSLNIPDSGITLDSGWNIKTISCQVCEDFNKLLNQNSLEFILYLLLSVT